MRGGVHGFRDYLVIVAEQLGIEILPVQFMAVENGEDEYGNLNNQYTIIGIIDEQN